MRFCELKEWEFREFLNHHPLKSFMQLPEMAQYKKNHGSKIYYVGVKECENILCATMMIATKGTFGRFVFYSPHGFLIDFENLSLLDFFTKKIRKFVKKKKGYVLIIDPYYPLQERDMNGTLVEGGFDNTSLISKMQKMGYFYKGTSSQAKYMFVLNLEGKDMNQILKEMETTTRSCIRQSLKEGVVFRDLNYSELEIFKKLTLEASIHHGFQDRSLSYYQEMYQILCPKNLSKFVVCEVHFDTYIKELEKELLEIYEKLEKLSEKNGRRKDCVDKINQLKKRIEEAKKLKEENGDVLILSGGMFLFYGDEVVYLFSGNAKPYQHFYTAYRIQYEMIRYAVEHHYKRYNFYGILGTDKNSPGYSVYQFKKGFHGNVIELVGEFELPINFYYYVRKFFSKLFHR